MNIQPQGTCAVAAVFWLALLPFSAQAQDASNVLVVVNQAAPISEQVAAYYAKVRAIPSDNILRLTTSAADEISRELYTIQIEQPIQRWLAAHSAQDRILFIVLTKGVPLRISGTAGRTGTVASVDSELTLLYRKMLGIPILLSGGLRSPYFQDDRLLTEAKPFSHETQDLYLVTRLDGFTIADITSMIDRGASPERSGDFLLDQKAGFTDPGGDKWLQDAATRLVTAGFSGRVFLEGSPRLLTDRDSLLGYYSWGSNDPAFTRRQLNLKFVPGALAATFVSSDARTFNQPPDSWKIGELFAGSPQSLIGDLLHEGATGAAGHVTEPLLEGTIRPNLLFPAYVAGFNLAESFYLAMPFVSWQTVVVGDPLCAPFRTKTLTREQTTPPIDSDTEMPTFFSDRRVQVLTKRGIVVDVARLLAKAEARLAHDDRAGSREPLEAATKLDPRQNASHLILAAMYEQLGDYDKAIERYRTVLVTAPNEVLSLNNLAYALAVRKAQPREALPFAEKAYKLSKGAAPIADTLGWIHHLLGNRVEAETFTQQAASKAPENAEIRFHMAVVWADLDRKDSALAELDKAVELDPSLEQRADVKKLRTDLK